MTAGAAAGSPVVVRSRKHWGGFHKTWEALRLGEDEHGVWLGIEAGAWVESYRGGHPMRGDSVRVIPRDGWWSAAFSTRDGNCRIYCDICLPSRWEGDTLHMVDLDLDVVQRFDGTTYIDDEDEFDDHRERHTYPPEVVERARAEASRVLRDITVAEPFVSAFRPWLDGYTALLHSS